MGMRLDVMSVLRWKGLLSEAKKEIRFATLLFQLIISMALTFTQLGFFGVRVGDTTLFYVIVLLIPIAVIPLLLGTIVGTGFGLLSGLLLWLRAGLLPLNYYEFSLVSPITSIILFGLCGFLQGVLLACLLRSNYLKIQHVGRVAVSCAIVSWVCSLGFGAYFIHLVTTGSMDFGSTGLAQTMSPSMSIPEMSVALLFSSQISVQAWVDAIVMTVACTEFYVLIKRIEALEDDISVYALFGGWLFNVVTATSLIAAVICFLAISTHLLNRTEAEVKSEAEYLCLQISKLDEHMSTPYDQLLDGYTMEDTGIAVVTLNNDVFMTDNEMFPIGCAIDELLDDTGLEAINRSVESGRMQQIFFAGTGVASDESIRDNRYTQIVYLFAMREGDYEVIIIKPSSLVFAERRGAMLELFLGLCVMVIAVCVMVLNLLKRVVGERIRETNEALSKITAGDLEVRAEALGTREFKALSSGINQTVDALKGWIVEAETRMDSELAAARAMQEAALPAAFPALPDAKRFDIHASMNPAREVGGDFYDFFLIGDANAAQGKLGFVLADVSGKGVPAALFMMKAKALLHDNMESGLSLSEAVGHANAQLCEGNSACTFVTAWIGVLDWGAKTIEYVNAGHNPPMMWRASDGWHWIEDTDASGPPLGLVDLPYATECISVGEGDTVFLYTDGVTEAENKDKELYGEKRLEAFLLTIDDPQPYELLEAVAVEVVKFADGAEQSDDLTMLAIKVL